MSNALQPWRGQDVANRMQPWAVLGASTYTPPPRPDDASRAPAQLSAAAIMLLDTYGRVKVYPKNTLLIPPGTPSPACYVVRSGRVRVYVSAPNGKELTLSLPSLGEPVGDLGLLRHWLVPAIDRGMATLCGLVATRVALLACGQLMTFAEPSEAEELPPVWRLPPLPRPSCATWRPRKRP